MNAFKEANSANQAASNIRYAKDFSKKVSKLYKVTPGTKIPGVKISSIKDIIDFVKELGSFDQYIMISSSAVYPEYGVQPFLEESEKSENKFWGAYGTDKIAAEKALLERVKDAYILRPPYLYGPMNNVY